MAQMRAEVSGPWAQDSDGIWIAGVCLDYLYDANEIMKPGTSCSDVTGNNPPTAPDLVNVEVVADEPLIDQIDADPNYLVLWSELI